MVNVLVRHKVADYDRWKEVFDEHLVMRKSGGEMGCRLFYNAIDGSDVILLCEWETLEKAQAFFASESLKSKMEKSGVTGTPEIVFLDEVRQLRRTSAD